MEGATKRYAYSFAGFIPQKRLCTHRDILSSSDTGDEDDPDSDVSGVDPVMEELLSSESESEARGAADNNLPLQPEPSHHCHSRLPVSASLRSTSSQLVAGEYASTLLSGHGKPIVNTPTTPVVTYDCKFCSYSLYV